MRNQICALTSSIPCWWRSTRGVPASRDCLVAHRRLRTDQRVIGARVDRHGRGGAETVVLSASRTIIRLSDGRWTLVFGVLMQLTGGRQVSLDCSLRRRSSNALLLPSLPDNLPRWRFAFDRVLALMQVCNISWKLDPGRMSDVGTCDTRGVCRASTLLPDGSRIRLFRNVTLLRTASFRCGLRSTVERMTDGTMHLRSRLSGEFSRPW